MLQDIKRLGKETLVYGTSTVLARLLNFCLVPFYTYYLVPAQYGVIATLFAVIALLNVVFLFGMDQSYLRFASEQENKSEVFQHAFYGLAVYGSVLGVLLWLFAAPAAQLIGIGAQYAPLIKLAVWVLVLDMLNMIPFTQLRLQRKAWYFAGVRTASIVVNVACNIWFIAVLKMGIESILWANIAASAASLLLLSPVIWAEIKHKPLLSINKTLRAQMLHFAWPFVPAGLASLLVSVIDKPILIKLVGVEQVGVYQANFKIGVFMMLLCAMFDQAWRPFFLSHAKDENAKRLFARVLTFFVAGGTWFLLGLALLTPLIIKSDILPFHLISPAYWGGLSIIPLVLTGYFFYGIYINFMVGPIITKKTRPLMWITLLGAGVSIAVNLLTVPHLGLIGAGWAVCLSYAAMAGALFVFTQKVYPMRYEYKQLGLIALLCVAFAGLAYSVGGVSLAGQWAGKIGLLILYPLAVLGVLKRVKG